MNREELIEAADKFYLSKCFKGELNSQELMADFALSIAAERDELKRQVEIARTKLKLSIEVISDLAEQQAMEDDWYIPFLNEIREALTQMEKQK